MANINVSFLNDYSDELLCESTCPFCGRKSRVTVTGYEWMLYECGESVQDAFPTLPASQRELFITGMCETCQEKIFG